jgi:hypothetical protein
MYVSMSVSEGRGAVKRTGHHALKAAEVDVCAIVQKVKHLVRVLLDLRKGRVSVL